MGRRGEKIGWIGGWLGGTLFFPIGAVVWLSCYNIPAATIALMVYIGFVSLAFTITPWKYPQTKYWKLLLPYYLLLIVGTALLLMTGFHNIQGSFKYFSAFYLLPAVLPFFTVGEKTWV